MNEYIYRGEFLTGPSLRKEYINRKKDFLSKSVPIEEKIPDGWKLKDKENPYKNVKKIIKQKDISLQLEDKVWCLFYEAGMTTLSTRNLSLIIRQAGNTSKTVQCDAVAVDEDVVFIVECKTQKILGKCQRLEEYIATFIKNKKDLSQTIKKIFPGKVPVFVFATENIRWDENSKIDVQKEKIIPLDEYEIDQLLSLTKIAGEGAKYQLFNRIFQGKKIKKFEISIPALKASMGNKTYYTFSIEPAHLLKFAYVNQRRDSTIVDIADSYQRIIKPKRIKKIRDYVRSGGFFPNSIILNFNREFPREEGIGTKDQLKRSSTSVKPVMITLPPYYGCAWIIDGQHRLYSFADMEEKERETISVVAFVEKEDKGFQAKLFMDINENQKSVEAKLRWDLYEDLYFDSDVPEEQELYIISIIAKKLNRKVPFKDLIEIPKEGGKGHLTLTTICESIKRYGFVAKEGPFRKESAEDTIEFAVDRISSFFEIISIYLNEEWNQKEEHFINHNAGILLLSSVLRDFIPSLIDYNELNNPEKYKKRSEEVLLPIIKFISDFDSQKIKLYKQANRFTILKKLQFELIERLQEEFPYRSKIVENIKAQQKRESLTKGVSLDKLLEGGESQTLEAKGSFCLDLNHYIENSGKASIEAERANDILKAVTAFLNTNPGGKIVIGALERTRYEKKLSKLDFIDYEINKIFLIIGIEIELEKYKNGWDDYELRLQNLIKDKIKPSPIALVNVRTETIGKKQLCTIEVTRDANYWYYLQEKEQQLFYVRQGAMSIPLSGTDMDNYKSIST